MKSDQARTDDLQVLMAEIAHHHDHGRHAPCTDPAVGHWWISDDPEHLDTAARRCAPCPAFIACTTYRSAHAEVAGVWAGRRPRASPTTQPASPPSTEQETPDAR